MAYFLVEHVRHAIGHRPHAFSDLSSALKTTGQSHINIPIFIGSNPALGFHGGFGRKGTRFHAGVDFVAGAVEKARVNENDTLSRSVNTLGKIDRGTPLLIHDADLDGVFGKPKSLFNPLEQVDGEGHLVRAMHFRFNDIHASASGVFDWPRAFYIMDGTQHREHGIHDALGHFFALGGEYCVIGHEVADITDEEKATSGQGQGTAIDTRKFPIGVHPSRNGFAPFGKALGKVALHQPQPVAVHNDFVLRVHSRDRILTVLNSGECRLQTEVLDPSRIGRTDGVGSINLDFHMQTVMTK